MSLLTVVRDVCAVVGVVAPTSVFSNINTNRTMFEMVACANEMAQRIAGDLREWRRMQAFAVFTGDGVQEAFPLPADYKRMLVKSNVWSSTSTQQPMVFISDTDAWLMRRLSGQMDGWGEWTLLGGDMHFAPALAAGQTAHFAYLHRNCIALTGGGYGDRFMDDADTFVLDERLLKLGMIFEWKKNKGSPYAENMGEYSDALAVAMGSDRPAPILSDRLLTANGGWNNAVLS